MEGREGGREGGKKEREKKGEGEEADRKITVMSTQRTIRHQFLTSIGRPCSTLSAANP